MNTVIQIIRIVRITYLFIVLGAFFQQTNILSRQTVYADEMSKAMSAEALSFYSNYYTEYQQYLSGLGGERPAAAVQSHQLYDMLDHALLSTRPQAHLHNTPWRYSLYHVLAWLSPTSLRDRLVTHFTAMPTYRP